MNNSLARCEPSVICGILSVFGLICCGVATSAGYLAWRIFSGLVSMGEKKVFPGR